MQASHFVQISGGELEREKEREGACCCVFPVSFFLFVVVFGQPCSGRGRERRKGRESGTKEG